MQQWYQIFITGFCLNITNNEWKCKCDIGWGGSKCDNATCDEMNNCANNGIKFQW